MIDQATIDRILDAAQIVDVVSEFVTLRKRGVNYVGLCPFHNEKTPSFSVSPSKGLCKCFSCGKGGNAVHFVMEHEQMSYYEALKYLAKKYNIEIKERELTNEEKQAQSTRESMFIVNNFARDYFQNILKNHVDGRSIGMAYFRQRGFRDDIIEKFQLIALPLRLTKARHSSVFPRTCSPGTLWVRIPSPASFLTSAYHFFHYVQTDTAVFKVIQPLGVLSLLSVYQPHREN